MPMPAFVDESHFRLPVIANLNMYNSSSSEQIRLRLWSCVPMFDSAASAFEMNTNIHRNMLPLVAHNQKGL